MRLADIKRSAAYEQLVEEYLWTVQKETMQIMDPSILIVVLVFMATVGATFSGFKTVNLIVKGDTWQLWAILTGVLIFVAALGFLLPFMF